MLYGAIILQVFPCWILKGVSGLQIEGVQSSSWQFWNGRKDKAHELVLGWTCRCQMDVLAY